MNIIGWVVLGAAAGWIASRIMRRDRQMNWVENIVIGIIGALIGGFLYSIITDREWDSDFDLGTLLVAILGAVIVLAIWNAIRGRGRAI